MSGPPRRMSSAVVALLLVALAWTSGTSSVSAADPSAATERAWIVTLQPAAAPSLSAGELARSVGGTAGRLFKHALNGFVFHGSAGAAAALARNSNVRTVVADRPIYAAAETTPPGIRRIDARHPSAPDAHDSGFTGSGTRIAIIDTGIDLSHPDLLANLDTALGINCYSSGPPQDGHGHGTHVAGIAAAVGDNGQGVVGVAHQSRLVPVKVLSDSGTGEWSNVICGIDYLTGLMLDDDPTNDVHVANMSLGDTGSVGHCADGGLREAICNSVAAGITYIAAAGNSTTDAAGFIPAAFPEVIAVSAVVDLDGEPGGLGGCAMLIWYCDDTLAEFSNYGLVVDVTAPGYDILSTWKGGGYQKSSGTSMAAPHVAGVAALVSAARPGLTAADVAAILMSTGECPNGQYADADGSDSCSGKGQWKNDPDGYGEPLVNALRAPQAAPGWVPRPVVNITHPADGATVAGVVGITADASDDSGIVEVAFTANGDPISTDTNGSDGWSAAWDTTALAGGTYSLKAVATNALGRTASSHRTVFVEPNLQGDWVGNYGAEGYILAAWHGTSSDLALLPAGVSYVLEQGTRYAGWPSPTTDVRALESPDESERRARTWYHSSQLRVRLSFTDAYSGTLHLYALDWDTTNRRQNVTVDDGRGPRTVNLTTSFNAGVWLHYELEVAAGGSVVITADRTAGANAVLAGVFLGDAGASPPTVPGAPQNLSAIAGDGSVELSWSAPADDGGSPITGYNLYRGTSAGELALLAALGEVLAYSDMAAVNGTTYYYGVAAVNAAGEGALSEEVSATPDATTTVPGAPQNLSAIAGDGSVELSWSAPADDGGLPITGYTVTGTPGEVSCTTTQPTCSISGLTNGTSYAFTVTAANEVGTGPASEPVSVTPLGLPGAPQNLTASPHRAKGIDLAWSVPLTDGGSAITGYRIYRGTVSGSYQLLTTVGSVISYRDTTTKKNVRYYYVVTAVNQRGEGPSSNESTAIAK
jgi:subtilisin